MIPDLSTPLHHDDNVFWSHFFSYASHSPQEGRHFVVFFHDREGHGVAVLHDIASAAFFSAIDKSLISRFAMSTVLGSLSDRRGICAYDG